MNFMKDNHPFKKEPIRRRKKSINFFQTVREGKRTFTVGRGILNEEKTSSTSETSWMQGRRFIQPSRRTTISPRTGTETDVKTILSSLEEENNFGSGAPEDKFSSIFTGSSSEQRRNKKNKSYANWTSSNATKPSGTSSSIRPNHIFSQESSICRDSKEEVSSSAKGHQSSGASNSKNGVEEFLSGSYQPTSSTQRNNNLSFFDLNPSGSNTDAFTESFFISSLEDQKASGTTNLKGFYKDSSKSGQLQTAFGTKGLLKAPSIDHKEFFNAPQKQHLTKNSREVFFKTPPPQPQKPLSGNEGFFQLSSMMSPKNTSYVDLNQPSTSQAVTKGSNEDFFKVPSIKPQKPAANQKFRKSENTSIESFFKTSRPDPKRSPINQEFFDLKALKNHSQTSNEGFFGIPEEQPDKSGLLEEFFNTPTARRSISRNDENINILAESDQNEKPINYDGLLKTPMQPKPSTSFEGFFKPQRTETPSNNMFKTPKTQTETHTPKPTTRPQTTPRYDEFLKPQLNPKVLSRESSSTGNYDDLFKTPSRIRALPKMTTPHLFKPFEKTPSRTTATSVSKTNSKATSKTPLATNEESTFFVISVTEGRGCAICEIGLASIDLRSPNLILSQFSDVPTYKKLLSKINLLDPAEVLVPETFTNATPSEMYKKVTETFPEVRITTAKRVQFSAKNGLESIRQLMLPEDNSLDIIVCKKYYALAAAEALLRYIEIKHNILFSSRTLKVCFESPKDVVAVDFDTCQRLELVSSCANVMFPEQYSLFGVLNFTKTMGGKRRLRSNLMQPSSSPEQLEKRLGSVSALVNNQAALSSLQTCLLKFTTVERILWLCRKTPNFRNEANTFETLTNYILLLKGCLEGIPHLRKVLEEIDDDHIIDIRNELEDDCYELMLKHINKMIRDDARLAKGFAASSRERCYAIKEGFNDLLDVARATYSALIEHVLKMVTELGEEYCMPLKMIHSPDLGFHASYVLPRKVPFNKEDVPDIFTEVKNKNRTVHLLTDEMFNLNVRINRAMEEIQLITNVVIYDLVESLKEGISYLYRLCERVAELDLLSSLAQASSTPDYVRPVFGSQMSLVGARHPILDHLNRTKPIPNNFNASRTSNFMVITGPNMSGKTVYVLTVPLIQIMAQIPWSALMKAYDPETFELITKLVLLQVGCYVPADKAELRITDHIYIPWSALMKAYDPETFELITKLVLLQVGCYVPADKAELRITDHIYVRKGNADNMKNKLSSHGSEMKELSYTLKTLTSRSLIILDELCTSTSCQKGICLAWAFSEEFLKTSCFTFLATHYHYLCNLSKVYKNVKNFHMEAIEKNPNPGDSYWDLTFTFRLLPGKTQMTDYALRLMMASALPDQVKQYALAVAKDIAHRRETSLPVCVVEDPETVKELARIEKAENFMSNLKALCMTDKFTPKIFRSLQKMIREEILPDLEKIDDDQACLEEIEETLSTAEEQTTTVACEPQKVVDDAVNEFLKGEQEDQTLVRKNEHVVLTGSSRRSQARSKSDSADMFTNENINHSLRSRDENCYAMEERDIFPNLGQQETHEGEQHDNHNTNMVYSGIETLKHLTTTDVRSVPNEEDVESDKEEDDTDLYYRMEALKDLRNANDIHNEDNADNEEQNDNVFYPERNEPQNFMDLNDLAFRNEEVEDDEQATNIAYFESQFTPQNVIVEHTLQTPAADQVLNETAHSSGVKNTGEFEMSQKLPNIFSIENISDSDGSYDDFKDCEELSDNSDDSSSSSEGSYYINND